jgi:dsDNA-specific endonuclease/ATPase MutS2
MLEAQINAAVEMVQAKADQIRGMAITVINEQGHVSTLLTYGNDQAMAMLGAIELAKDQIKAKLTFD